MERSSQEKRQRWVFSLSFFSAFLALLVVLVFIALQAYIRWTTNQGFTFLGGNELEVLTASSFVLLLGLAYIYRPEKVEMKIGIEEVE
jgi:hypothetical protein